MPLVQLSPHLSAFICSRPPTLLAPFKGPGAPASLGPVSSCRPQEASALSQQHTLSGAGEFKKEMEGAPGLPYGAWLFPASHSVAQIP